MSRAHRVMKFLPAMAVAFGVAAPAVQAADILEPPVIEVEEVVTKSGGWYLRGDISYDFHNTDAPMYNVPAGGGGLATFTTADIDDAFNIGLGIGYQIDETFRVDLTGDYVFSADFRGSTTGLCGGVACTSVDTSSVSMFKLLANAYADLGTFNGLTPYIGGGIGGAYVEWDSLTNAINGGGTFVHEGTDSWRFMWALHAGLSYQFSHTTKLDFGYSYHYVHAGDMFGWNPVGAGLMNGTQGYDKGFEDHVLRAGIRYQIW